MYNISTLLTVSAAIILFCHYLWKRRWLYYYSYKLPGPFCLPLLGSLPIITSSVKNFHKRITKLIANQATNFRLWIGPDLYIVCTEPKHLEVLLNTFLAKGYYYKTLDETAPNALLTSPVNIWKRNRKYINHTFNPKLIDSFHDLFVKYANEFVKTAEREKVMTNLMPKIWVHTFENSIETLCNLDPTDFEKLRDFILWLSRAEDIVIDRFYKFWLLYDPIWKMSSLYRELQSLKVRGYHLLNTLLSRKENISSVGYDFQKRPFLDYLLDMSKDGLMDRNHILTECMLMFPAASESSAAALASAILVLGLYPDIQEKIHHELSNILGDGKKDPTLDEINQMSYLERVVKETMRLFPAIPFILRDIDKDIQLDSYVFPAGSTLFVSIANLHRRPEIWPNPLVFDPDRFLPEEVEKRHRCSFIPFSYGPRNCIGLKYGMISMKVFLAKIVQNFTIRAIDYRSTDEIEFHFNIIARPRNYTVKFEKRL